MNVKSQHASTLQFQPHIHHLAPPSGEWRVTPSKKVAKPFGICVAQASLSNMEVDQKDKWGKNMLAAKISTCGLT